MKRPPRPAPAPLAVRAGVVVAALVLAVVPVHVTAFGVTAIVLGTAAALLAPRVVGSTLVTAAFVLVWATSTGFGEVPSVVRTVLAAAALWVVHSGLALIACVPVEARVAPGLIGGWLRRSALPLGLAAVVVVVDEALPQQPGGVLVELVGLVGVALLGVAVALAVLRRGPSSIE